jgi:SAM-dependent methyltransferase
MEHNLNMDYWNAIADTYQRVTRISIDDFHYGPLLPGDSELELLPLPLQGKRCLELGAGAGQNSICLAGRGAVCTALDISMRQMEYGKKLAQETSVDVEYVVADMDEPDGAVQGTFDLVHSTYALPFSRDPAAMIGSCSRFLAEDGTLLLTTGHPLYAGDWVEFEPGEEGLFLHNYFRPVPDIREPDADHEGSAANYYTVATVMSWLLKAGFVVDRFLEPEPLPIPLLEEEEILNRIPYESDEWRKLYPVLSMIPVVMIFRCKKAPGTALNSA